MTYLGGLLVPNLFKFDTLIGLHEQSLLIGNNGVEKPSTGMP